MHRRPQRVTCPESGGPCCCHYCAQAVTVQCGVFKNEDVNQELRERRVGSGGESSGGREESPCPCPEQSRARFAGEGEGRAGEGSGCTGGPGALGGLLEGVGWRRGGGRSPALALAPWPVGHGCWARTGGGAAGSHASRRALGAAVESGAGAGRTHTGQEATRPAARVQCACRSPTGVSPVLPGADRAAEGQPRLGERKPVAQTLRGQADPRPAHGRPPGGACVASDARTGRGRQRAVFTTDPNPGVGLKQNKTNDF